MSSGPASGYSSGMTEVVIYTDGACSGNPGRGGWGAVLRWNGKQKELHGGEPLTTNNRMELMAAIQALEALNRPSRVTLHTDSKYLLDGITKWIAGWQRNGWLHLGQAAGQERGPVAAAGRGPGRARGQLAVGAGARG